MVCHRDVGAPGKWPRVTWQLHNFLLSLAKLERLKNGTMVRTADIAKLILVYVPEKEEK